MGGTERVRRHEEGVAETSVEGCVSGSMSEDGALGGLVGGTNEGTKWLKNSRGWLRVGDDPGVV